MTTWTMAGARGQAIVMAVEDIQWADPSTLDLLRGIAERGALAPLMVVITARPEFRPPWGIRSHHSTITLSPLDRRQVRDMIAELAARHALSRDVVENVAARTGGVPLFVEEVTRLLLEGGQESGGPHAIPPTLQQSLTARLDRLGSARDIAQIGAVIGRDFSYSLLRAVSALEDRPLQTALERLAEADILLVQGLPPDADYRFKHALIQDAAYENLLKSRRAFLHRRIAESLRDTFSAIATAEPELLAHHFTQAALPEAAIEWWGRAAQLSLERSALVEAIEQFKRALNQIALVPTSPALRRQEIKLQIALITPLMHVGGHAAPESKAAAERARLLIEKAEALGEPPDDPLLLLEVLCGLWNVNFVAFDGDVVRELGADILTLAEKQGETVKLMIGHRFMSTALQFTGQIEESLVHYKRALELYDPGEHRGLVTRINVDSEVSVLTHRSRSLWLLGYPEAARTDAHRAVKNARGIGHAATLMFALSLTSMTHILCGNYVEAIAQEDEVAALADEKGALMWKVQHMINRGLLLAFTGKTSDAIQTITSGITAYRATTASVYTPLWLSFLAGAYAELGQIDDAWRYIGEALAISETSKEKWCEAEVNRVAGEIALKSSEQDEAKGEDHFERALAVARQQKAKSWELRAAMSMARLWRDQGKRDEARDLLAPVYGWFTEGLDTLDLKEAKALLDELAA
jgi:predicted ATPase